MVYSPSPAWELTKADFNIGYTEMNKEENPHILSYNKSKISLTAVQIILIFYWWISIRKWTSMCWVCYTDVYDQKSLYIGREDLYLLQN